MDVRAVRFDGPVLEIEQLGEVEDGDLVVETCITRTLPPALTLEHGLCSIREAMEELKLDPPSSTSGLLRFQVAVPPSAKALHLFCCQPESSQVYPVFFISKDEDQSYKSLLLNETRGVFGSGAAAYFTGPSSHTMNGHSSIKRYLASDSTLITTYGFVDVDFKNEPCSMKHMPGSYYFFIPQIELDERKDVSVLAAMLVWSEASFCTFQEALASLKLSLDQTSSNLPHAMERFGISYLGPTLRKVNIVDSSLVTKVYSYVNSLMATSFAPNSTVLIESTSSHQFCIRLSAVTCVSNNMLDHAARSIQWENLANINSVWASMIIEECVRLGLTYFCMAPGSRSSPLALAAARHPLITCITCYDERSVAFHALGYARGSYKPAVVITTSGTAVSNLLPAVVEASQDFVPLLLLTADRPSELQDCGANQAINQVNHFGHFPRHFYNLPEPSDEVPARVALTALDSAVHYAITVPYGPVHINCPFREPLDSTPKNWDQNCLKGLDTWISNGQPFTKYIKVENSRACTVTQAQIEEVLDLVHGFENGLLVLGELHSEDEIWACLLLARHLKWPVVADMLSGLRLRRVMSSFPEVEDSILFVDHIDHILLSSSFRNWIKIDGILQIGSRITGKRTSQMLERCFPCPYILVDKHSFRHDPSHMITHRIQSSIVIFIDILLKAQNPIKIIRRNYFLQVLNSMVSAELSFQILAEPALTEPQVAHMVSQLLTDDHALFIGNSMVIRDVDFFGHSWSKLTDKLDSLLFDSNLPCQLIRVGANRGVSGIDGLVSTAVGFAMGSNKRIVCLLGDLSFMYDTNGLSLLSQKTSRKPMTIIVTNNKGGAIFSLLPIAQSTEEGVMNKYFYTNHNISLHHLSAAHGIKHVKVQTKNELQDALNESHIQEVDCIIEAESNIPLNSIIHSNLRIFATRVANHAMRTLESCSAPNTASSHLSLCKVQSLDYSSYKIPLRAPLTSTINAEETATSREGFILFLHLEDEVIGLGEVAPLEIHEENLVDVEEQLRLLSHKIEGANITRLLPLLRGSFSSWIWEELGIPPTSIFPSVRCGLEMAILNALAELWSLSLNGILYSQKDVNEISEKSDGVQVCALLDPRGSPEEVASAASALVEEGYTTIKIKVARRHDPLQDASIIREVRKSVGNGIELRADANRKWTYEKAIQFASSIKECNVQYIEEPVQDENDIIRFCEESGLPVALDETLDSCPEDPLEKLANYTHPGIVAVVLKPSMLGGFEKSALVARWAQNQGKMAVVSSTFESSIGLSSYIMFSHYLNLQNYDICKMTRCELTPPVAHGLGTFRWLQEDVTTYPVKIGQNPINGFFEASASDANEYLKKFHINKKIINREFAKEELHKYHLNVDLDGSSHSIKVLDIGQGNDNVVVFLHGFLGSSEDWMAIMKGISGSARCISIDLPGHGESRVKSSNGKAWGQRLSIEVVASIVLKTMEQISSEKVTLVGYSMGARITLFMALKYADKVKGATIISGCPGLRTSAARKRRRAQDDSKARILASYGLEFFLKSWYEGGLWKSLRSHPHFHQVVSSRLQYGDAHSLSRVLSDMSTGRQASLWEDLKHCKVPIALIVGKSDEKFKEIAGRMSSEFPKDSCQIFEIPKSGHAVHLENPLAVARAIRKFSTGFKEEVPDKMEATVKVV
ncbi:hypothetical protein SAY87_016017 [Trapa incisa]|uniref:Mandelate racemase/muconate lactonizing enzyme C-terminal domain-containing protein n=1 Tax=Trapa incisa TaxID=236973 RepID=A0AAN7QX43_9MYRT|nr:hypothetical protein SAY87_016017 [Trapa incisa]